MNLGGYHWNIKEKKFFLLHLKFEELYNDALLKVDQIAERVLTLSQSLYHTFSKYLSHSEINEAENVSDSEIAIEIILSSNSKLTVYYFGVKD
ncbi:MAG: hypothetical protein KTR26_07365 [Flammeovirgaceae bacterium]|nr:hypothetical protein [Flammeovirgaceae bacterium]